MIYLTPTSRYPFDEVSHIISELKALVTRLAEVRRLLEKA